MELIFELFLEIVIEGCLEIGTSRRVPMPLRILALLLFLGVFGGLIVLFVIIGLGAMEDNPAVGWLMIIIAVLLAVVVGYAVRKKAKEKKND